MAQPPLTYLERKWAAGYSSNLLYETATQNSDRKSIPRLDYDTHRNVSTIGRRTMLSLGRWLFSNFSTVRGALLEQAEYASSHYLWQYAGENEAWGKSAAAWLTLHDRICDVRGWPFNMRAFRRNLILSVLRDGDLGVMLVKSAGGYPLLQVIPSHRIGSQLQQFSVTDGPYKDMRIIDGVIVDDVGAPVAYRVMSENPWDFSTYQDVPARDMILCFAPEYPDQTRGFSALGASLFDWQDVKEARGFELLAQKVGAAITLIERNEAGEAQPGADFLTGAPAGANTSGTPSGMLQEIMSGGGLVRYLRSTDPRASIEGFKNDRPTANQQDFEDRILRSALCGMHWSVDFSLKPGDVGRSSTRVVIEKINRALDEKRDLILDPTLMRFDAFRLSVAMFQLRLLQEQWDWYKFGYQPPARFTADAKYDSDIDINENRAGIRPLRDITGSHGEYWEDVQDQIIAEEKRLQERCKAEGVDPNRVKILTANGNVGVEPAGGQGASGALPPGPGGGGSAPGNGRAQVRIQSVPARRRTVTFRKSADKEVLGAEIIEDT